MNHLCPPRLRAQVGTAAWVVEAVGANLRSRLAGHEFREVEVRVSRVAARAVTHRCWLGVYVCVCVCVCARARVC